ncbi:sodium ion-translocating decarboxylase subunit beta [bacterium]|nr:sodium ion-translocating decarboxylase subunit beta [bacterium]
MLGLDFGFTALTWGQAVMIIVGGILLYLGIARKMEPLLLATIGFGAILANLPLTGIVDEGGLLTLIYLNLIKTGLVPLLIFLGIGAMTDFGPLLADPKTFLLGAAAQIGIFCAMLVAILFKFPLEEACTIGIIGGADGPTTIYTATKLAPSIIGSVSVAAYSYMALVPIIQPPIIRLLTSKKERSIRMESPRKVPRLTKILFPVLVTIITGLLVPSALPIIGMLMFGNLLRESKVTERLAKSAANEIINIATVFLGLGVGYMMTAEKFLNWQTIAILFLGVIAFATATAGGTLFGKLMCWLSKGKINPMIGAAGVSAVPMASRVVQKLATKEDPENYLLMNAMGPNVAGVIGSAIAAGVFIGILGG